jgi:death-on-curing protein
MTDYLTLAEALAIHDDQLERYGGSSGVRDLGLLDAALFRPQTGYYADLIEEAAALWESMSQNHPFIDGNKRTAFAATYTFLAINGARLTGGAQETYDFVAGLYDRNQFSFDKLVPWLRRDKSREHVELEPPRRTPRTRK